MLYIHSYSDSHSRTHIHISITTHCRVSEICAVVVSVVINSFKPHTRTKHTTTYVLNAKHAASGIFIFIPHQHTHIFNRSRRKLRGWGVSLGVASNFVYIFILLMCAMLIKYTYMYILTCVKRVTFKSSYSPSPHHTPGEYYILKNDCGISLYIRWRQRWNINERNAHIRMMNVTENNMPSCDSAARRPSWSLMLQRRIFAPK